MSDENEIDFGRINYLSQIRTFLNLSSYMELTPQESALYCQLLEMNNRSGWKEWILATNTYLQKQAHITSYGSFANARANLVKKGFIHFISGGTGMPSSYSLVKLYDPVPDNFQEYLEKSIQRAKENKESMNYMERCHGEAIKASIEAYNSEANAEEETGLVADLHDKKTVRHHYKNEVRSTTKITHIHKHNKTLKKAINDEGSQKERASQADCQPKYAIDPVAMDRHAAWFVYFAKGNKLSHNEQKNLDYIELYYSTAAIEAAMHRADAKEKRSVGYVRRILDTASCRH